ncbi:hypothetical protein [uncultured Tenacibaculum sp.]|uniref:hypothetical protein n=1 Tax=uncultured Tenacibaculum sp. TaxID=174713 RepID=UPI002624F78E|nr:hypothetical protein [uncultured Tenacibaculum sp.]
MESGFIIKELRLTSPVSKAAKVKFGKGLNVIVGPSDCGKSYIFQCINYMLGSSAIPKGIKESKPYDKIYLEIKGSDKKSYSLKSDLNGGDFMVYEKKISKISEKDKFEVLKRKHQPKDEKTISAFLLKLNGLYAKKIRLNSKGKIRELSYRDIVRYAMVNETDITKDKSVVESNRINATADTNTFKLLVTGNDDSNVKERLNDKEVSNRKGRIEALNDLIKEIHDEIPVEYHSVEVSILQDQVFKLEGNFDVINNKYIELNDVYSSKEKRRSEYLFELSEKKSSVKILEELKERSFILDKQYEVDLLRLKSTIEASELLIDDNHTYDKNCPICDNVVESKCDVNSVNEIIKSCIAEEDKIKKLLIESYKSRKTIEFEINKYEQEIDSIESTIKSITKDINEGVAKEMKEIYDLIQRMITLRTNLKHTIKLKNNIKKYSGRTKKLEGDVKEAKEKVEYVKLTNDSIKSYRKSFKNVLNGINFPDLSSVKFDEEEKDFIISGKKRGLSGKGIRAIIYSSFLIALQEYLSDKIYSLGVTILDSPLVTYKKREAENNMIPIDLAMDFYRYVGKSKKISQVIIMENEEPPKDLIDKITYIKFGDSKNSLRKGFIPQ